MVGRRDSARTVWTAGLLVSLLLLGAMSGCTHVRRNAWEPTPLGSTTAAVPPRLAQECPPPNTKLRLPDGALSTGVVGVRLCPAPTRTRPDGRIAIRSIQPPADELVTGGDELVELLNSMEAADPQGGYFDDGGYTLVYWFRYADGDARAVSYDAYGGHLVVTGETEKKVGGADLAKAFSDSLGAQRRTARPTAQPPRPDCDVYTHRYSALPMTDVDLSTARLCVDAGRYRFRAASVPAWLVERLNADLLTGRASSPQGTGGCAADYWRIEGYTAWGDRVTYAIDGCRRVSTWPGPGRDVPEVSLPLDRNLERGLDGLSLGPVRTVPSSASAREER